VLRAERLADSGKEALGRTRRRGLRQPLTMEDAMANLREMSVSMTSNVRRLEFRLPVDPMIGQGSLMAALYEVLCRAHAVRDADPDEAFTAERTGTTGGGDPDLDPDPTP
jgi:hypothetical protein